MRQRQIEELALCGREARIPAPIYRKTGKVPRQRIPGESLGLAAMDVARELVEQDHRREERLGVVAPSGRAAAQHQVAQGAETLPDILVDCRVLGEMPV